MATKRRFEKKIKNLKELKEIILKLKKQEKRIVFTNGCFDILHFGHVKYLQEAKQKGDILVVGINSDASVRKIKGRKRPLVGQHDRLNIIAALESVDYVILFHDDTPLNLIFSIKPDVLVKGSDWKKSDIVGSDLVLAKKGQVFNIKLVKGRSTTNLIRKIASCY